MVIPQWCWVYGFKVVTDASDVKHRPIMFKAPMVRAILEGRKTQTRRPVKHPDASRGYGVMEGDGGFAFLISGDHGYGETVRSPKGRVGDRLWVKETWAEHPDGEGIIYRSTDPGWDESGSGLKWRSSMFMPRTASRLTLEIVSVRVERVEAISDEDARAEGVQACGGFMASAGCWMNYGKDGPSFDTARESFLSLWRSMYGGK